MDVSQSRLFTPSVSGGTSPYSYQWYLNGGVNGTGSSWTFSPVSSGSYSVYVNVTDNVGVRVKSNVVTITVNKAPAVTVSPTSLTMDVGQSESFNSSVTGGSGSISYQWYLDGSNVSGATEASWTYTPSSSSVGSHTVYLNVSDAVGFVALSSNVTVIVNVALSVSFLPSSVTMDVGESLTFAANVTGGTWPYKTYFWGYGISPLFATVRAADNPTTNATWDFTPSSTGFYYVVCLVIDSVGGSQIPSATSYATVTVNAVLIGSGRVRSLFLFS
jgi:hypothetical protein